MARLILPYPPSVNHYWLRNRNGSVRVSKEGVSFRQEVWLRCRQERIKRLHGRLSVEVAAYPPDLRKRDLDNILKALLDALKHGGAYDDDGQIDRLLVVRCGIIKRGQVTVRIEQLP